MSNPRNPGLEDKSPAVPDTVLEPSSSTHLSQWKVLSRMSKGPRAASFPQLSALFQGDKADKLRALKLYLDAGESLQRCEAQITVTKKHKEKVNHRRQWLTIRAMKEQGFSENLNSSGLPDEDAPNDPDSVKYRCSTALEEDDVMENEASIRITGDVQGADALRAMQMGDPRLSGGNSVRAADPLGLVREQLAASQQPATPSVAAEPARPAGT
eukprot:Skav228753  [mRNA]  locus=scaffold589:50999:51755:+ [translate_table: standard]